jgi:hypothetical protein
VSAEAFFHVMTLYLILGALIVVSAIAKTHAHLKRVEAKLDGLLRANANDYRSRLRTEEAIELFRLGKHREATELLRTLKKVAPPQDEH